MGMFRNFAGWIFLTGMTAGSLMSTVALAEYVVKPEDLPPTFYGYKILQGDKSPFVMTGVPRRDMTSGTISFLAVSPINPVAAEPGVAANKLFGLHQRRPMTWSEAAAACQRFDNLGQPWRLPNLTEIKQLNMMTKFVAIVATESPELDGINEAWRNTPGFNSQYRFFWMDHEDKDSEEGLKYAGTWGEEGRRQKMTEASLLSYVCVTQVKGEMREVDRLAIPTSDKNAAPKKGTL